MIADLPKRDSWTIKYCGVLCFIKDSAKRSYYIRAYDITVSMHIYVEIKSLINGFSSFAYFFPNSYKESFRPLLADKL